MKTHQSKAVLWILLAVAAGWSGPGQARELPANYYACQVLTSAAFPAVALVQANSVTEATELAKRTTATTFEGYPVKTAKVVQCIRPDIEKFTDTTFQQRFEKMER